MFARIRLTLRQHRFETIAVTVLCLGVAIAGFIEAWRLHSLNFPQSCLQDGHVPWFDTMMAPTPCSIASQRFHDISDGGDMSLVLLFQQIVPFIVGIAFGAPIVAREIETGTAPLSWALAGSRVRWLLGKLGAVVLLIVPLLLIAGLAADARQGALVPGVDPHATFDFYADRGVFVVFWGLAAFFGTVALGTIFGRTMPAVMVALLVCVFARGLWESAWNHTVLRQFAVVGDANSYNSVDLHVYESSELYLDGKVWTGDINAWWQAHVPIAATPDPSGVVPQPADFGPPPQPLAYVIHGSQYWLVATLECATLLAGSLFCGAIALLWVGRRKPY
jgi:hypothetical protein